MPLQPRHYLRSGLSLLLLLLLTAAPYEHHRPSGLLVTATTADDVPIPAFPNEVSSTNATGCPVVVLKGAPAFTQSVFGELVLNASQTLFHLSEGNENENGSRTLSDTCADCIFTWEACHFVERRNQCLHGGDLPPPFVEVPTSHDRVLRLPIVTTNYTCTNLTGFPSDFNNATGGNGSSCGANRFGEFDVMALSGETYRFRVTVESPSRPHCSLSRSTVDVYFDLLEIPAEESSSSSWTTVSTATTWTTWSSSESGCFPQVYAVLDGPFELSVNTSDAVFLNASGSFVELLDGSLRTCGTGKKTNCTFAWTVCLFENGQCATETFLPSTLAEVFSLTSAEINVKAVPGNCGSDPLCADLSDKSFRFTVEVNNGYCPMAIASIVVHYGHFQPHYVPTPTPTPQNCDRLIAVLKTVPLFGPFSVLQPVVVDASQSHYEDDHQQPCRDCTFSWMVCRYDEEGRCLSFGLPPPLSQLMNSDRAQVQLAVPQYMFEFVNQSFAVDAIVTDPSRMCSARDSALLQFYFPSPPGECQLEAQLDGAPGFSHSIFDDLTLDATQSIDRNSGNCENCSYAWDLCHLHVHSGECVYQESIPLPLIMLNHEYDPIIHLPLALLNVSCQNNSNITIGLNSSCVASPYGDFDAMALSGESFRFTVTVNKNGCLSRAFVDVYFDIVGVESSSVFTEITEPVDCTVKALVNGFPGFTHSIYNTLVLNASLSYRKTDNSLCTDCGFKWSACHYATANARCFVGDLPLPLSVVPNIDTSVAFLPLVLANVSCNSNITLDPEGICATSPYGDYDVMALADETFRFTLTVTNGECQDSQSINVFFKPVHLPPTPPCTLNAIIDGAPWFSHSVFDELIINASSSKDRVTHMCEDCHYRWQVCHLSTRTGECIDAELPSPMENVSNSSLPVLRIPLMGYHNVSCVNSTDVIIRGNGTCLGATGAFDALALTGETYQFAVTVIQGDCASTAKLDVFFNVLEIVSESSETPTPLPPTATPTPPPPTNTPTPHPTRNRTRTPTPLTRTPTLTYQETYGDLYCEKCLTFYYAWEDYIDDIFYCELVLPFEDGGDYPFNEDGSFTAVDAYPDDYPIAWEGHELIFDEEYSGVWLDYPLDSWDFAYDPNDDWEDPQNPGVKDGFGELFILSYRPPSEDRNGTWLPSPTNPYEVTLYPQCDGGQAKAPASKSNICDGDETYVCDIFTMEYNNETEFCNCVQIDEESSDKVKCVVDVESDWKVCETDVKSCKTNNPAKVSGRVRTSCGNVALRLGKGTTHYFKFGDADKMKKKNMDKMMPMQTDTAPSRSLNITERDPQRLPQGIIFRNTDGVPTYVASSADARDSIIRLLGITQFTLTGVNCSNTNVSGLSTDVVVTNVSMRPTFGANRFAGQTVSIRDIRSQGNLSITGVSAASLGNVDQTSLLNTTKLPNVTVVAPVINLSGYFKGQPIMFVIPLQAAYAYNPDNWPREANVTITLTYEQRRKLKVLSSKWHVQQVGQPTMYMCGIAFSSITVDTGTAIGIGLGCLNQGGPMQLINAAGSGLLKMNAGSSMVVVDWTNPSVVVPKADECVWSGSPPFTIKASPIISTSRTLKVLQCSDRTQAMELPRVIAAETCDVTIGCNCSLEIDATNTLVLTTLCPAFPITSPGTPASPGAAPGSRGGGNSNDWPLILGLCLGLILGCCLLLLIAYLYYRHRKKREEEAREIELDRWAPPVPEYQAMESNVTPANTPAYPSATPFSPELYPDAGIPSPAPIFTPFTTPAHYTPSSYTPANYTPNPHQTHYSASAPGSGYTTPLPVGPAYSYATYPRFAPSPPLLQQPLPQPMSPAPSSYPVVHTYPVVGPAPGMMTPYALTPNPTPSASTPYYPSGMQTPATFQYGSSAFSNPPSGYQTPFPLPPNPYPTPAHLGKY